MNIEVPDLAITLYIIAMIFACFVEKNEVAFSIKQKIFIMMIAIGIILLIITGMYVTWTTVGGSITEGVQGRYFIPIAFLILLCLCKKNNYIKIKNIQYKLPLILFLLNLPALQAIYEFFK